MFPSLVNCCTIDWFEKWPHDALLSVSQNALQSLGSEEVCNNLSTICVTMHEVGFGKSLAKFFKVVCRVLKQ
jgi:dynein heavy chain